MPGNNYKQAIAQAINGINQIADLDNFAEAVTREIVIMPLIRAAGWDQMNWPEVQPEYPIGNGKVDYALNIDDAPRFFIEVKAPSEKNLERHERQLLNYCTGRGVRLAALTNGRKWLLYLPMYECDLREKRFSEIDLKDDHETAVAELNKYLVKSRVANNQAANAAERVIRDRLNAEKAKKITVETWNQLVEKPGEALIDLITEAANIKHGFKPDSRYVEDFLAKHKSQFRVSPRKPTDPPQPQKEDRHHPGPTAIIFSPRDSEMAYRRDARSWGEVLTELCDLLYVQEPSEFEKVLEVQGNKHAYFSRFPNDLSQPKPIGDTGVYAACHFSANQARSRCDKVLKKFGYPRESLTIETN